MTKWLKGAFALVVLFALGSCAGIKPGIPFDRSAHPIKVIGIIDPYITPRANMILVGTVGQNLAGAGGLIGALIGGAIDESMRANRVSKFKKLADGQSFVAHDVFVKELEASLQKQGYETVLIPIDRATSRRSGSNMRQNAKAESNWDEEETSDAVAPTDFRKTYPPAGTGGAEAFLDVIVYDYGYLAAGIGSQPYRPYVGILCRLVDANTHAVLMEDNIAYNPLGQPKNVVVVPPDQTYAYRDFDTLIAAGPKATEGLDMAFKQSADTLATLLR